ncbi:DUF6221 family protein [Streptomyces ortus]|uniref:DUF6221 family protein n=1 Tax=Streptomyces ortus TaxID=2867268 RepID=A0ABT3UWM4_9ACTN|nr:DUF6221 family protein [Streptomyces ortus]MCX4231970.1 DUF6221 family protein [Streptomyces ortus]
MDGLVKWLGEQLDEDFEAVRLLLGVNAMAAYRRGEPVPRWVPSPEGDAGVWDTAGTPRVKFVWARERDHIIRHDPARVLREIEAKRQLIHEHADVNDGSCGTCVDGAWGYPTHGGSSPQRYPCKTLRLLALPYADRPGYDESWRP